MLAHEVQGGIFVDISVHHHNSSDVSVLIGVANSDFDWSPDTPIVNCSNVIDV
jgi:hypothetical protein